MGFERLLRTTVGGYIISAILGFGAATLLTNTCPGDCITRYAAPPAEHPRRFGDGCWRFDHRAEPCASDAKSVYDFA